MNQPCKRDKYENSTGNSTDIWVTVRGYCWTQYRMQYRMQYRQCDKKPGVFRVLSQRPKWAHPSAVLIVIEQPYWCRVDRHILD